MRRLWPAGLAVALAALVCLIWRMMDSGAPPTVRIEGWVMDGQRPVSDARVRIKGSVVYSSTDEFGRFQLGVAQREAGVVTAAKEGYLIASARVADDPLEIHLTPLPEADHGGYQWVHPAPNAAVSGACGNCHQAIYDEWQSDGHAQSAVSPSFQSMHAALGRDYPEGVAVCWSCHAPSLDMTRATPDHLRVTGVAAAGVHCDFCHKIRETDGERAGLTHGRFGYDLLRPAEGQLFFGPLEDVDRGEDAYSPLMSESRFCAACHEGTIFGVHVYSTWSEWLASPARRQGRQCQTCHMAPSGKLTNIAPMSGGIERDPRTLASHTFLPGGRAAMLRRALAVSVAIDRQPASVDVSVRLEAHEVGHRLPTGFIDRQLLLIVEAIDAEGHAAGALGGGSLPPATGTELSGKAGRIFSKLLTDEDGNSPAPFWRAGVRMTDTRLLPDEPAACNFTFPIEAASVQVRLIYRRLWGGVEGDVVVYDQVFQASSE